MKKDFPIYNKLYAQYFSGEGKPNPTRTTIEVGALPTPIAIELKVIAAIGQRRRAAVAAATYRSALPLLS
jgi:enamine deaminase RidA (YjgF/YER057c/UK114 family)